MHYLFERRLNMLEIAIHGCSDEELAGFSLPETLLREYSILIPELLHDKAKESTHKKEVLATEGPEGFHLRHKEKAYYYTRKIPFSSTGYLVDILPMRVCEEGLSITPEAVTYIEYSHTEMEGNTRAIVALRAHAEKAIDDVALMLDEYAANAVEFNQLVLPVSIVEKIQAERLLRFEKEERARAGMPAYA
jgi:hypothetical protein